ncbi:hypothetical protein QYE76_016886 [Lolium multiflorum]|uniref:RING-type domain-containing protein n=1 Tax=Lolium multiflorum TaxID=4521 RepID=A0AAD8QAZ8_LOLMU|nr:hypothetical protein QYE76_016886 [Lolium multiflorum]
MEAMSKPRPERPFTKRIDSKLMHFHMQPRPDGQPCTVRFGWCSMNLVKEHHLIGGERTRHVEELEVQEQAVAHPVHGGPAVLGTKSACRRAIRRILMEVLPARIQYCDVDRNEQGGQWDEFVPADLVENIVAGVLSGGWGSYACEVWMHVEVTRVYSEAEELLLSCEAAAVAPSGSDSRRAPGAGDACPICMEELADGGVTGLPDCSHAFHRECILKWFEKAATCPCCRRDMMHYLTEAVITSALAFLSEIELVLDAARRANSSRRAIRRHRQRRAAPYSAQHDSNTLQKVIDMGITLRLTNIALPYTVQMEAHEGTRSVIGRSDHVIDIFIDIFIGTAITNSGRVDELARAFDSPFSVLNVGGIRRTHVFELTSYYCSNCDARHDLGSSDTPFIRNAQYSSEKTVSAASPESHPKNSTPLGLRRQQHRKYKARRRRRPHAPFQQESELRRWL